MLSTFLNCTGIITNRKTACLGSPIARVLPGSSLPVAFQWPLLARPHGFVFSTCLRTGNGPLCPTTRVCCHVTSESCKPCPIVPSLSYELDLEPKGWKFFLFNKRLEVTWATNKLEVALDWRICWMTTYKVHKSLSRLADLCLSFMKTRSHSS